MKIRKILNQNIENNIQFLINIIFKTYVIKDIVIYNILL